MAKYFINTYDLSNSIGGDNLKKKELLLILTLLSFGLSGCGNVPKDIDQNGSNEMVQNVKSTDDKYFADFNEIVECYQKVYEQAVNDGTLGTLDTVKKIVESLGDAGYVAVDNENQVNMVNSDKTKAFIDKVEEGIEAELTIVCVSDSEGFTQLDLQTSKGEVYITRSYISWNGKTLEITSKEEYSAYSWNYSEDGYLFFEQYHMPGYDGPSGHTALRIEYLDDRCRELNRQYLLSIGYGSNNMFASEWNENDFSKLNFYDLFDILYPLVYKKHIPYEVSYEGELYYVPQEEFERVIKSYFKIDNETLRSKTTYLKENQAYKYRTRGFDDWGANPNTPYPEVVQYEENSDGTIKLIVNVVYDAKNISCAFSHEVVIRQLPDGGVQYVSNRIIPSEKNMEPIWYIEKFTDEEWEELYGEQE